MRLEQKRATPRIFAQLRRASASIFSVIFLTASGLSPTVDAANLAVADGKRADPAPAPRGTPSGFLGRLNKAILKALKSPEMANRRWPEGYELVGGTPEEMTRIIRAFYFLGLSVVSTTSKVHDAKPVNSIRVFRIVAAPPFSRRIQTNCGSESHRPGQEVSEGVKPGTLFVPMRWAVVVAVQGLAPQDPLRPGITQGHIRITAETLRSGPGEVLDFVDLHEQSHLGNTVVEASQGAFPYKIRKPSQPHESVVDHD